MRRSFTTALLLVLAGGFLVTTADVRVLGVDATSVGLLLLTIGLGIGLAGELAGLEEETRLAGAGLALTVVVTVVALAITGGLIPALALGLLLSLVVGFLLSRRGRPEG